MARPACPLTIINILAGTLPSFHPTCGWRPSNWTQSPRRSESCASPIVCSISPLNT
jgi:hypothetical protein